MLVRGQEPDKALNYIDQLSYTFRYVLQSGRQTLVPLDEELRSRRPTPTCSASATPTSSSSTSPSTRRSATACCRRSRCSR